MGGGGGSQTQYVAAPPAPAALDPAMLEAYRRRRDRRTGLRASTILGPGAARPGGMLSEPGLYGGPMPRSSKGASGARRAAMNLDFNRQR